MTIEHQTISNFGVKMTGLGYFPLRNIADFKETAPASWVQRGGVIMPMRERDAMWMSLNHSDASNPVAVKVGVGLVNGISGWLRCVIYFSHFSSFHLETDIESFCIALFGKLFN